MTTATTNTNGAATTTTTAAKGGRKAATRKDGASKLAEDIRKHQRGQKDGLKAARTEAYDRGVKAGKRLFRQVADKAIFGDARTPEEKVAILLG